MTSESEVQPTSESILKELEILKEVNPEDTVLLYFSGHGINFEDQYYFLTADAKDDDLADPEVRKQSGISSEFIANHLKMTPARKTVLVLDTCASGQMIQQFYKSKNVSSAQIRALERLKDRTGFHVLAGCAGDKVSYESNQFGQGLLTYGILDGMRTGEGLKEVDLGQTWEVSVQELFRHALDKVPAMAGSVGGHQVPMYAAPKASNDFSLGILGAEEQQMLPKALKKLPVVTRPDFQHQQRFADVLKLGNLVQTQLRESSHSSGNQNEFQCEYLFVGQRLPNSYFLSGRYEEQHSRVQLKVKILRVEGAEIREVAEFSKRIRNGQFRSSRH